MLCRYGSPILDIKWHRTLNSEHPKLITTDHHVVRIWDPETVRKFFILEKKKILFKLNFFDQYLRNSLIFSTFIFYWLSVGRRNDCFLRYQIWVMIKLLYRTELETISGVNIYIFVVDSVSIRVGFKFNFDAFLVSRFKGS